MGTWRLELFLFPIAVWNGIMSSTQPKSDVNAMNPINSASESLFFKVIPTRVLSTDRTTLADLSPPHRMVSNRTSYTSKVRMTRDDKDDFSDNTVSVDFQNGSTVGSDVLSLNVNENIIVLANSSHLDLNENRIDARNITEGNNTTIQIMMNSGKVASRGTGNFVYIIVRCGIFFGGICLIFLVGIGIYRARTRCRPKWYDKI